jgi:hypothetical protein
LPTPARRQFVAHELLRSCGGRDLTRGGRSGDSQCWDALPATAGKGPACSLPVGTRQLRRECCTAQRLWRGCSVSPRREGPQCGCRKCARRRPEMIVAATSRPTNGIQIRNAPSTRTSVITNRIPITSASTTIPNGPNRATYIWRSPPPPRNTRMRAASDLNRRSPLSGGMISGSAPGFSPAGVRRSFITSPSAAGPDMGDAGRHNKRSAPAWRERHASPCAEAASRRFGMAQRFGRGAQ